MNPSILLIIASDPRTSHRPAEAIRIAAGVGAWKRTEMTVYLRGPAVLALSEVPDGLVDEENYRRYLPMVRDVGRTIYAERGADLLGQIGEASAQFEEIDDAQLAALAARSTYTLRF